MAQYQMNLRDYQRILRKRYKIIVFTTVMLAFFSFLFARQQVPLYHTTASVKIDQSGTVAGMLLSNITYNVWDNLATQSEVMKSFDAIEDVAKRLGRIDPNIPSDEVRRSDEYIGIIKSIQGKIATLQSGNTNIVDITVTSTDPDEARDIANMVALVFREKHRTEKQKQATETSRFITERLDEVGRVLKTSEDSLKIFQLSMRVPDISTDARDAIQKLNDLENEYTALSQQVIEIDQQLTELRQRQNRAIPSLASKMSGRSKTGADSTDASAIYIDWISSIDQQSQSLALLNNNLLTLELQKMDKLLYYNEQHPEVADLEAKIQAILGQLIREYTARVNILRDRERTLRAKLAAQQEKVSTLPDAQRKFAKLQRDVSLNESLYSLLLQRQQEMLIRKEDTADEVSVVKFATLPTSPDNANTNQVVMTGLIVGALLGLVLAFVFETLDTSIGTIEDVEEYLELPVLGVIPHIDIEEMIVEKYPHLENDARLPYYARLITLFSPKTPVSESYRTLRTTLSLSFGGGERPVKAIVFTSASLQEGKSTTLANLAIVTAQSGKRTLLVGCNLRRPSIYKTFGIERTPGVTDIILGSIPWEDCVRTVTDLMVGSFGVPDLLTAPGLDNLHIIEAGHSPPNPSELLSSPQMEKFIAEVSEEFDVVYIDMPPTLPVTDSSILSPKVDGVVLIYQVGRVPRNALKRAKNQLQQVGAHVLGVVLNDVRAEITGFHPATEYFIHYYGEDAGKQKRGRVAALVHGLKEQARTFTKSPSKMKPEERSWVRRVASLLGVLVVATGLAGFLMSKFLFRQPDVGQATPRATARAEAGRLQFADDGTVPGALASQDTTAIAATPQEAGRLNKRWITVPTIGLRSGPAATYDQVSAASQGEQVLVVDTQQSWSKIVLSDGRVGWIPTAAAAGDSVKP